MDDLETHEERRVLPRTCFSVEPGIYLPGQLGVRIEDFVVVAEDGYRNLSSLPKDLQLVE